MGSIITRTRALDVECPTCDAAPGCLCTAGPVQLTTYHHPRIREAGKVTREQNRRLRCG